ncbi:MULTISPECIES: hypothetical protein [unclassified Streptomyces]|uniref:hypothetical protein n=1 Tax=unclassified Streptomyces TaxID=2593676 RepID=UPI0013BC8D2B|nr:MULTISPECIES: hypothetical protein [unclassified Streptomyces]NEB33205.1 hypothetical protein [Streptomyces sp. SID14446]WSD78875.1 hypothetical protein OHB33_22605 [Streptomyces sp. NBC_01558]WSK62468.1 hypothetical protein OG458_22750 [Streptomyces sp. NBC_01281]
MEQQDITDPVSEHRATTVEQGPFCLARCTCGWRGPARRARSQARADGAAHTTGDTP